MVLLPHLTNILFLGIKIITHYILRVCESNKLRYQRIKVLFLL